MAEIKVIELFAGVGGFRLGLEGWNGKSPSSGYKNKFISNYKVVWGNQWEPGTKSQHAFKVYSERFSGQHSNEDIQKVIENEFDSIPNADVLVGGFPCQDYSVARTLNKAVGINGKKGVLWWSIHSILDKKIASGNPIKYLMLENVDRLLKSPVSQRGKDYAIMLASLSDLGYAVEWRVINAADYGMPQRRRRVFFIAYYKTTATYKKIFSQAKKEDWIYKDGVIAKSFPVFKVAQTSSFSILGELPLISESFNLGEKASKFKNSGVMIDRNVYTAETKPNFKGDNVVLNDIIIKDDNLVGKEFFLNGSTEKWEHQKGAKKIMRTNKSGYDYEYAEGSMTFPDDLFKPSRTIITGEGGATPSRFKHVIVSPTSQKLRRLVPLELERLNMFPDNHTQLESISDIKRAFFMGNALVIGIVEKLGIILQSEILS